MSAVLKHCLIVLIIISLFRDSVLINRNNKGFYTIVAPKIILPDSTFHVSFTLNDFHKNCWFNLTIHGYSKFDEPYRFKSIEVEPNTTKLVEFKAPHFNGTIAKLEVIGYRGIINEESNTVYLQTEEYWCFIQTNKAKYKPGELVKFRLICIDQLGRPAKTNKRIYLEIFDDQNNLIRSIMGLDFVKGVFRSQLQLSDYPVLGIWSMKVKKGDDQLAYKSFEVDRYELHKFYVQIQTRNVAMDEEKISFEISANYFYEEPVIGNLTLIITNLYAPYPQKILPQKRHFPINGNITIILDLKKDLQIKHNTEELTSVPFIYSSPNTNPIYTFHIEAAVVDGVTEDQSWSTTDFLVYSQPYNIEIKTPKVFKPEPIINIKVQVIIKDLYNNLIEHPEKPIEIIVGCYGPHIERNNYADYDFFRNPYEEQTGNDFAIINIPNKNYSDCHLYAEYQNSKSITSHMFKSPLEVDILTEKPQEGKEIKIKIKSLDAIEEFSYEIVARRDIILSGHVNVPGNQTTFILRLNVTFSMVPKIAIFVHHIKNMGFRGHMKEVIIERAYSNSIGIETENESQPGSSVYINITTDQGSYVGLMGLDRSALANIKKEDIFDLENVNNKLKNVNSVIDHAPINYFRGIYGDITVFSNALEEALLVSAGGGGALLKRVRKNFPESWLYLDFDSVPEEGLHLMETAPDTITTWAITAFSIHPETGLTFTKNTTNLRIFQEFFISMDLPSLVTEGEIIEVPIYISNYLNQDAMTNVRIETDSEGLDILDQPESSSNHKLDISMLVSAKKKREKIVVFIKPLKPGSYNVTVEAISPLASDAIQKTLYVQSQGLSYSMSKTYLIHLPEESTQENEITINIPENALPESQRVEVLVVGDIFRPLIDDLQKLARVPYGNGEDNMRLIVSNSIVLRYLKALNHSSPSLEAKIKLNLELGYQNHLSFRYLDGSFGFLERKIHYTGDVWQTILSLWALRHVDQFVPVDSYVIKRGLQYLKSKQQENGCYKSISGTEDDVKFTALGLMVFLMDEDSRTTYKDVISRGLAFLYESSDDVESSSISVMSTYALLLGKHEKVANHLKKLTSSSGLTNKQMLWTTSNTLESHLEAIASSLINMIESQEMSGQSILYIVRALISSKPATEETSLTHMIALQAMLEYVEKLLLSSTNLEITLRDDQNKSKNFRINSENSQVSQSLEISPNSRKINLKSKGQGLALVDVRYSYNLLPENQTISSYEIRISTKMRSKFLGDLNICSSVLGKTFQNQLTKLEVNLPSGFVFTEKVSAEDENLSKDVKSLQVSQSRNKLVAYIELTSNQTCLELEVHQSYKVLNSKPGWIVVYGAHDKEQKTAKSFKFDNNPK